MPVTYDPPSGVDTLDGNNDTLTINLDNENGAAGSNLEGIVGTAALPLTGNALKLTFDTDDDGLDDDDVLDIQDFTSVTINADAQGSDVTLAGDLSGTADINAVIFTGSGAADSFDGSGITSTTPLTLNGNGGDDTLTGGAGTDTLSGGDDSDTLDGGMGVNIVSGGSGNDTITAGAGDDTITGGDDIDTYDASAATGSVTVTLGGAATGSGIGTDSLAGVENAIGGSFGDTLTGDLGANVLTGNGGADVLSGGAGTDTLVGGAGNDTLTGGADADSLDGGGDVDTVDYSGSLSTAATIVWDTDHFEVTIGGVTDEVVNVETLNFSDKDIQLVGGGSEFNIQEAISAATAGDTIILSGEVHDDDLSQIVVDRNVDIVGQGQGVSVVEAQFNTGSSGDARGWFLVNDNVVLNVSGVTFDGDGQLVWQAFRHRGSGTFDDVEFTNIKFNESGPHYAGTAIAVFGTGGEDVDVTNSTFSEIGRVGVLYFGTGVTGTFDGNTYTGKGTGDHLDYALDVGAGAVVNITNNVITDNLGVASVDGSGSAGVLITTFSGGGSGATISGNTLTDNTTGIFVGFNSTDSSAVTIGAGNVATGGDQGMVVVGNGVVTTPENLGGPNGTIIWNGGPGNNIIGGAALGDDLTGGAGNDTIDGAGGNDTITESVGDGNDSITGGLGTDTLNLQLDNDSVGPIFGEPNGDTSNLTGTIVGSNLELTWGDTGHVDTVNGVENIVITADTDGSTVTMSGDLTDAGVSPSTVTFTGGPGNDTYDGSGVTGVEQEITGAGGNDTLKGGSENDDIDGGSGDDALTGNGGDDTIIGGANTDTAHFAGDLADYSVSFTGGPPTITVVDDETGIDGDDGTDTLTGVESLVFADTTVLIVDQSGDFGAFTTIQAAVNAANDGNTILIRGGTYNETVTIDDYLTIIGDGAGSTIVTPPSGANSGFVVTTDLGPTGTLSISGISFVDAGRAGIQVSGGAGIENLVISDSDFTSNYGNGIEIQASSPTAIGSTTITGSNFTDNGGVFTGDPMHLSSGDGDILFFGYAGDATLSNLTLSNGAQDGTAFTPPNTQYAENGIQFRYDSGPIGEVSLSDIDISGIYEKRAIAIIGFDNVDDLTASDVVITADSVRFNESVAFDGIGGDLDFSTLDIDVSGAPDPVTLQGDATANVLTGGDENTVLVGGGGNDTLNGGGGNDTFVELVGDGSDSITGGADTDTLQVLLNNGVGTTSDLTGTIVGSNLELTWSAASSGVDTVSGVENIVITADPNGSTVTMSGDLTLAGVSPSTVTFTGGAGDDTYDGSAVTGVEQEIFGNGGNDTLSGGAEDDLVDGGADNDVLAGNGGNDTLFGGTGNDSLDGGSGNDAMTGAAGDDTYFVDSALDTITELSGGGTDLVVASVNYSLAGDDDLENLTLVGAAVTGTGNNGDNVILGNANDNTLDGGAGNDSIDGGTGNDSLLGGADNDTLTGGLGDDSLDGGSGNDIVNGGDDDDTIVAVSGDGDDTIDGGSGTDTYNASALATAITVTLGAPGSTSGAVGTDSLTSIENVTGGSGNDTLTGDGNANVLDGGDGDDSLSGEGGADTIDGGAGDDSISYSYGDGSDAIDGGEGSETAGDTLTVDLDNGVAGPSNLTGTAAGPTLTLTFDDAASTTVTNVENLVIDADPHGSSVTMSGDLAATGISDSTVVFNGSGAADTFNGSGVTSTTTLDLNGGGGNDTLTGGAGNDLIDGGTGDDTLRGNGGDDTIDGGADSGIGYADVAVYSDNPLTAGDITFSGSWQVASVDGTDSLTEIETVRDGTGNNFLLVGGDGFATIQAAVNAANDGDTIVISAGTYNETVTIDDYLTIVGAGAGSTIVTPPSGANSGFVVTTDLGPTGTLSISGISFVDAGRAGIQVSGGAGIQNLVISDSDFTSNYGNGIEIQASSPTAIGSTTITGSNFTDNGGVFTGDPMHLSSGDGDILFFGYAGDATLSNLTLSNGAQDGTAFTPPNTQYAENGIQFRYDSGPIGEVSLSDIDISGIYEKRAIAIIGFDNVDDLTASDVVITADSVRFNESVAFDGIGGDLDFSTLDIDVSGAPDPVTLQGDATANVLTGGDENTVLVGGGGNDTLNGGGGNDTFVELVGDGSDSITGGADTDTLQVLLNNGVGTTSNLTGTIVGSNLELTWSAASSGVDTVSGVENIVITADPNGSTVTMSGDLTLAGVSPSTVTFTGGAGDDTYDGSAVTGVEQEIFGNGGNDTLSGGGGNDTIDGGIGNDTLSGGAGNDTLTGGTGNDSLDGGTGNDAMTGGADNDSYTVDSATDSVTENPGEGTADLVTSSVDYTLAAEVENLTLVGAALSGTGNASANIILGNGNDNTLSGLGGDDTIDGGAGNDSLLGGADNDGLTGGLGNDSLDGGSGNDSLDGGAGNDTLVAGAGDDSINGGTDTDTYDASATSLGVVVNLGTNSATGSEIGTDTLTASSVENATGGSGADTLTGDGAANVLTGNGGADAISGGAGNDTIFGGAGNDTIDDGDDIDDADGGGDDDTFNGALDGDDDTYRGSTGTDTIRFSTATAAVVIDLTNGFLPFGNASGSQIGLSNRLYDFENLQGGSGNDTLTGNALANVVYMSAGTDTNDGVGGTDTYDASAAATAVTINLGAGTYSVPSGTGTLTSIENAIGGAGSDNIIGSSVANVLTGNGGDDGLSGGDGNDRLIGGAGNDTLVGGNGDDTAVFSGNYADYTVDTFNGTVTDNNLGDGNDGTDSYFTMEHLEFADQTIDLVPSPIANDDLDATGPSGNLAIEVLDNDTESDGLTPLTPVSVTANLVSSAPSNGLALVLDDDRILYVGDDGYSGPDSFDYTITTAEGSDTAQVDLVVQVPGSLAESSFINGNNNDEILVGNADANFMFASGGNDDLYTLVGEDTADGGSGNDLLVADGGANQLTGGLGTDLFVLTHESNDVNDFEIITDWNQGQGDQVLVALEGLTQDNGDIASSDIGILVFSGDTFLLADLDNNNGTGSMGGLESVIARLDNVTGATTADIVFNDLV